MTKNKIISTLGYNHLEPGSPGNLQLYRICGAKTRNELTVNELCQLPAGWGTSHAGVGKCKLHGGGSLIKTNRYSKLWRGRMAEIAHLTMDRDDSDPLDLLAELDVQRVLLSVMLDRLNGVVSDHPDDTKAMAAVREYVNQTSAVTKRKRRDVNQDANSSDTVGSGGGTSNDMVMEPVDMPLAGFSSLDVESDSDAPVPQTVNAELIEQIRQQLNDIVQTVTRIVAQRNQTAITKSEITYLLLMLKEGMNKFVPKENHEAYVRWLMENIPHGKSPDLDTFVRDEEV